MARAGMSIRLAPYLYRAVKAEARERHMSMNALICLYVEDGLQRGRIGVVETARR